MRGIEPPSQAWEACVLPLNHIRVVPLRERSVTTGRVAAESALRTGLELLESLLRRRHDLLNGIAEEGSLHRVEGSRIPRGTEQRHRPDPDALDRIGQRTCQ